MSDSKPFENRGDPDAIDPTTPVPISLQLHEAIAIAVMYERTPDDIDLWDDGVWWGESVDLAMLRLAEGISRAVQSKEGLLNAGAARARMAQRKADEW